MTPSPEEAQPEILEAASGGGFFDKFVKFVLGGGGVVGAAAGIDAATDDVEDKVKHTLDHH